jgi:hypothetical protein
MVDRMLTRCRTTVDRRATVDSAAALRDRVKLAREESRMLCDELMAEEAMALIRHDLIAA